jgi:integrase
LERIGKCDTLVVVRIDRLARLLSRLLELIERLEGKGAFFRSCLRRNGSRFSGHSLRAGLASSAEVDERYVLKQLGHASAKMTRRYQRRRDRFNLTNAAGL